MDGVRGQHGLGTVATAGRIFLPTARQTEGTP